MSLTLIYVELAILIIAIVILVALFITNSWFFSEPWKVIDPRTGKSVNDTTDWLKPTFDYSPLDRDTPEKDIQNTYCKLDKTRCITSKKEHSTSNPPTGIC